MPQFLVIGAAKAGTTALYFALRQHPQVFMTPLKEPGYFAYQGHPLDFAGPGDQAALRHCTTTTWEAYQAQFAGMAGEQVAGEASTAYLYHPQAAARIHAFNPAMRLIALLRHPAERAYAAFLHLRRDGREPLADFAAALAAEPARRAQNWEQLWHYAGMGFYAAQLRPYFRLFPRQQIQVHLFEDWQADPAGTLAACCRFLGVDDSFQPPHLLPTNVSGLPRHPWLQPWLAGPPWARRWLKPLFPYGRRRGWLLALQRRNLLQPPLPAAVRQALVARFRQDIEALQEMIGRDLGAWLELS